MKPGRHVVHRDADARHFDGERARIAEQGRFRGRIGGIALVRPQRRHRADDDDAAVLRPHHRAHQRVDEARERPVVHLHGHLGLVLVHHHGEAVVGVAGIVDEAANRAARRASDAANASTAAVSARSTRRAAKVCPGWAAASAAQRRLRLGRRRSGT